MENIETSAPEPASQAEDKDVTHSQIADNGGAPQVPQAEDSNEPSQEQEADTQDDKPKRETKSARYRRQLEAARAENERLQAEIQEFNAKSRPKFEDYNDLDGYEAANTEHSVSKALRENEALRAQRELERLQREHVEVVVSEHNSRVQAAKAVIPDYDQVIRSYKGEMPNETVTELLLNSQKSDLILYHFAGKPELVASLNRLSPLQAAVKIGELQASLSTPKPRTETKAPPPMTSLKGGASPSKALSEMSYQEYRKARGF